MGLNPIGEGQEIIVRVPSPTEESRAELAKVVRSHTEQAKVRLRKQRQKAMQAVKRVVADKDDRKGVEKDLEKLFEEALATVQDMCALKEKEIAS